MAAQPMIANDVPDPADKFVGLDDVARRLEVSPAHGASDGQPGRVAPAVFERGRSATLAMELHRGVLPQTARTRRLRRPEATEEAEVAVVYTANRRHHRRHLFHRWRRSLPLDDQSSDSRPPTERPSSASLAGTSRLSASSVWAALLLISAIWIISPAATESS